MSKYDKDKTETSHVRLSGAEKQAFVDFCQSIGVSQSKVLRRLIREMLFAEPSFFEDEESEMIKLRSQLSALGVNVNQIAKRVNSGQVKADPLSADRMNEIVASVREVSTFMSNVIERSSSRGGKLRKLAKTGKKK